MTNTMQNIFERSNNSVLEARDRVLLIMQSWKWSYAGLKEARNPWDRFYYFRRLSAGPLDL